MMMNSNMLMISPKATTVSTTMCPVSTELGLHVRGHLAVPFFFHTHRAHEEWYADDYLYDCSYAAYDSNDFEHYVLL